MREAPTAFVMSVLGAAAIDRLRREFPDRGFLFNTFSNPIATVTGPAGGLGEIEVHDDEEELTVMFGDVTHSHIALVYYDNQPVERRTELVLDELCDRLKNTFDDKFFFRSANWGGMSASRGAKTIVGERQVWLWSRKLKPDEFY